MVSTARQAVYVALPVLVYALSTPTFASRNVGLSILFLLGVHAVFPCCNECRRKRSKCSGMK